MCIKDLSEARELHWRAEKRRRTKSVTGWEGAFKFFTHSHITRTLNFCHVSTLFSFLLMTLSRPRFLLEKSNFYKWIAQKIQGFKGSTLPPDDAVFSAFILFPFAVVSLKWMRGPLVFFFFYLFLLHSAVVWPKHSQRGDIRVLGWYSKLASVR